MINKTLNLKELYPALAEGCCGQDTLLTVYAPENSQEIDSNRKRTAILILPGGSYFFTSDREAEPIALSFLAKDFCCFVLRYSVAPSRYPQALLEVSAAMDYIRKNADEYHVNSDKIVVCGFSAGGHLAASLGTLWNEDFISETLGIAPKSNQPNGLVLCYPVISSESFGHADSFNNLLGENPSPALLEKLSAEKQVGAHTPPAFIWHTFVDDIVPAENALVFASAMKRHDIPFELHIYSGGYHGMSLCNDLCNGNPNASDSHMASWLDLCVEWIQRL